MDSLTKFSKALGLVLILCLIILAQGGTSEHILSRAQEMLLVPVQSSQAASATEAAGMVPGALSKAFSKNIESAVAFIGVSVAGGNSNPAFISFIPWQEGAFVGGALAEDILGDDSNTAQQTYYAEAGYATGQQGDTGTYDADSTGGGDTNNGWSGEGDTVTIPSFQPDAAQNAGLDFPSFDALGLGLPLPQQQDGTSVTVQAEPGLNQQPWWSGPGLSNFYSDSVSFLTGGTVLTGQTTAPPTFDFTPDWMSGLTPAGNLNDSSQPPADTSPDTASWFSGLSSITGGVNDALTWLTGGNVPGTEINTNTGSLPPGDGDTTLPPLPNVYVQGSLAQDTNTDTDSWFTRAVDTVTGVVGGGADFISGQTGSGFTDAYYNLLNLSTTQGGGQDGMYGGSQSPFGWGMNGGGSGNQYGDVYDPNGVGYGNNGFGNPNSSGSFGGGSAFSGTSAFDAGGGLTGGVGIDGTSINFLTGATTTDTTSAFTNVGYMPTDNKSTREECLALAKQAAQNEANEVDYLYVEKNGVGTCMRGIGPSTPISVEPDTKAIRDALNGADAVVHIHTHPENAGLGSNVPPSALDVIFSSGFSADTANRKLQLVAVDGGGNIWKYQTTPVFDAQVDQVKAYLSTQQVSDYLAAQGIDPASDPAAAMTAALSAGAAGTFGPTGKSAAEAILALPIMKMADYEQTFYKKGGMTDADIAAAIKKYKDAGVTITKIP